MHKACTNLFAPCKSKPISTLLRTNSSLKIHPSLNNICNFVSVHNQREFSTKLSLIRNSNGRDDDAYNYQTQPGQPKSAAGLEQFNLIQYDPYVFSFLFICVQIRICNMYLLIEF